MGTVTMLQRTERFMRPTAPSPPLILTRRSQAWMLPASLMGKMETEAQRGEVTCRQSHSEQSQVLTPRQFLFLLFCQDQWPVQELKMQRENLFRDRTAYFSRKRM